MVSLRQAIKAMEMRVRAQPLPGIRTLYRALRSFGPVEVSRQLPAELLRECRFYASRYEMLDALPQQGIVAELGTYKGDFARHILARNRPRELHVIDIDYSRFDERLLADTRIKRHQGLTHETIVNFPDAFFDWIYVDADHSYAATIRDARASARKIRAGGFLVFNDFAHIDPFLGRYGVHRAVVDFALETRWPLHFFAYQTAALYDVALRKPRGA
jgi:Methyltransferase domain